MCGERVTTQIEEDSMEELRDEAQKLKSGKPQVPNHITVECAKEFSNIFLAMVLVVNAFLRKQKFPKE